MEVMDDEGVDESLEIVSPMPRLYLRKIVDSTNQSELNSQTSKYVYNNK